MYSLVLDEDFFWVFAIHVVVFEKRFTAVCYNLEDTKQKQSASTVTAHNPRIVP